MARWSLIQCQAPCTAFAERTSSDRSTWSLLSTGRSKSTMIGLPTPTVSPGFGVTSLTAIVCGACSVVNLLEAAAVVPLRPVAAACTTYDPPGASAHRVRQLLRSADTTPGTVAPVPAPPDAPAPSAAWDDAGSPTPAPDALSSNTAPASDPTLSASPSWRRAKPVRTCTRIRSRTHTSAGPPHQPPLTSPSHLILTLEGTERFRVAESQSPAGHEDRERAPPRWGSLPDVAGPGRPRHSCAERALRATSYQERQEE